MTIRVLRILEYRYETFERMEKDMGMWHVGANALRHHGDMSIRSATMVPSDAETIRHDDGAECALSEVLEYGDIEANRIIASLYEKGWVLVRDLGVPE